MNIDTSPVWNRPVSYSELSRLPAAEAVIKLRPINVATPESGLNYYSTTRVKVIAVIKWKSNLAASGYHQSELSTTLTKDGMFDKANVM